MGTTISLGYISVFFEGAKIMIIRGSLGFGVQGSEFRV
jgi:hypothetical protein